MPSRRRVLAVGGLALAGGAGCVGESATSGAGSAADATATDTDRATTTDATTADGTTTTDATATDDATEPGETTASDASGLRIAVADDGEEVELATGDDVATVGEVGSSPRLDGYRLPLTLTDEGTETFLDGLERVGAFENPESHRIRTYFEGELLYEARLGRELADAMESGEWDGQFLFNVSDRETAEEVKAALEGERETTRKSDEMTTRKSGETTTEGSEGE